MAPQKSKPLKIGFIVAPSEAARSCVQLMKPHVETVDEKDADILVVFGGDGTMLKALHKYHGTSKKVYGMNCGSVGFLMNQFSSLGLEERIQKAKLLKLAPLKMEVQTLEGKSHEAYAFNEVSLLRQTYQSARIRVLVDQQVRLEELMGDGALVATPAGSSAYNFSAHGPILPLGSELLALTPISAFRPRRWRGAVLPSKCQVEFSVITPENRPVSAVADFNEVRHVVSVKVYEDKTHQAQVLFDPEHNLEDRILQEQFSVC